MKILHCNWSGNLGGAEDFAFQLAKAQKSAGHDVTITYMTHRSIIGEQAIKSGIKIFECNMKNGYDFLLLSRCFRFIKKEKFDIIHNHNGSPFLNLIRFFSSSSSLINHLHGTSLGNEKWAKKYILFWHKISSFFVDHYVANSNHTKDIVIRKYMLPPNKVSVIYNGIDLECFKPDKNRDEIRKEFCLEDSTKVIGTVARLSLPKGIDKFIEVSKRVTREINNVKFIIVGDGELRASLENRVSELNLNNKVIFAGARTDVPNLLSIFDIFLLTSNREAFGIILLEAMAIGVPIIAFAVDGVPEVIDNDCAMLIETGEVEAMSQQVLCLLNNETKRRELIDRGYMRVRRFNLSNISNEIVRFYEFLKNQ